MKAILVIDMPDGCGDCDLSNEVHGYYENCLNQEFAKRDEDYYKRPSWCPLRPLPESISYEDTFMIGVQNNINIVNSVDFMNGWNMCLAEITGETE